MNQMIDSSIYTLYNVDTSGMKVKGNKLLSSSSLNLVWHETTPVVPNCYIHQHVHITDDSARSYHPDSIHYTGIAIYMCLVSFKWCNRRYVPIKIQFDGAFPRPVNGLYFTYNLSPCHFFSRAFSSSFFYTMFRNVISPRIIKPLSAHTPVRAFSSASVLQRK